MAELQEGLRRLALAGARTHAGEALVWAPRRFNKAADGLVNLARSDGGGRGAWLRMTPWGATGGQDLVAMADAGATDCLVSMGGAILTRGIQDIQAVWMDVRSRGPGETPNVNEEEAVALLKTTRLLEAVWREDARLWDS